MRTFRYYCSYDYRNGWAVCWNKICGKNMKFELTIPNVHQAAISITLSVDISSSESNIFANALARRS